MNSDDALIITMVIFWLIAAGIKFVIIPIRARRIWDREFSAEDVLYGVLSNDERLIWFGRPTPRCFSWPGFIVRFLASVALMSPALIDHRFAIVVAYVSMMPLIIDPGRALELRERRTAYAITDRRAIILQVQVAKHGIPQPRMETLMSFSTVDPSDVRVSSVMHGGSADVSLVRKQKANGNITEIGFVRVPGAENVARILRDTLAGTA